MRQYAHAFCYRHFKIGSRCSAFASRMLTRYLNHVEPQQGLSVSNEGHGIACTIQQKPFLSGKAWIKCSIIAKSDAQHNADSWSGVNSKMVACRNNGISKKTAVGSQIPPKKHTIKHGPKNYSNYSINFTSLNIKKHPMEANSYSYTPRGLLTQGEVVAVDGFMQGVDLKVAPGGWVFEGADLTIQTQGKTDRA